MLCRQYPLCVCVSDSQLYGKSQVGISGIFIFWGGSLGGFLRFGVSNMNCEYLRRSRLRHGEKLSCLGLSQMHPELERQKFLPPTWPGSQWQPPIYFQQVLLVRRLGFCLCIGGFLVWVAVFLSMTVSFCLSNSDCVFLV